MISTSIGSLDNKTSILFWFLALTRNISTLDLIFLNHASYVSAVIKKVFMVYFKNFLSQIYLIDKKYAYLTIILAIYF